MQTNLTVDEALLRRMARDAAIYALTRPWALVMWVALVGALVVSILNLGAGGGGAEALLPVACVALMVYAVVTTVVGARRAVRAAMPPGTAVWVRLDETVLRVGAGQRTSEIPYDTFQSMRAGADAVLLKLRGAGAITTVPRALLTDADIALLRHRIG